MGHRSQVRWGEARRYTLGTTSARTPGEHAGPRNGPDPRTIPPPLPMSKYVATATPPEYQEEDDHRS